MPTGAAGAHPVRDDNHTSRQVQGADRRSARCCGSAARARSHSCWDDLRSSDSGLGGSVRTVERLVQLENAIDQRQDCWILEAKQMRSNGPRESEPMRRAQRLCRNETALNEEVLPAHTETLVASALAGKASAQIVVTPISAVRILRPNIFGTPVRGLAASRIWAGVGPARSHPWVGLAHTRAQAVVDYPVAAHSDSPPRPPAARPHLTGTRSVCHNCVSAHISG